MTKASTPGDMGDVGRSASVAGPPPCLSLADEVYNLSLKLAKLRWQSAGNVDALRCVAQGVPELQQAFSPLYAAVEAALAECHQANLAAVFGRRAAPPREFPGTLSLGENGRGAVGVGRRERGGSGVGGRTAAAARHLATALSALDGDVRAAALLAGQGESFRVIARWAARKSATATAPATRPPLASALALSRPERAAPPGTAAAGGGGSGDRSPTGSSSSKETDEGYGDDPREGWAMRVFRARGGASSTNPRSAPAGAGARPPSSLVVVKALKTSLPTIPWPPAPTASDNGATPTACDHGGRGGGPSAVAQAGRGSALRGPLSWLTGGRGGASAAAGELAPRAVAPPPPPSLPRPPKVVVRVVYSALAPDMLRLVTESERRGVSPTAATIDADDGRDTGAPQRGQDGLDLDGARGGSSASVELLRSEVRVRHVGLGGAARAGDGEGERAPRAAGIEEVEPGSESCPIMQLQVVLQLRTETPVVVSRLLHTGGSVHLPQSPSPPPRPHNIHEDDERHRSRRDCRGGEGAAGGGLSSGVGEEVGGGGRGDSTSGGCGSSSLGEDGGGSRRKGVRGAARGDQVKDVIPSEWGDAPVELCPPKASAEGECELKVGTAHLLGISIALPPAPAPRIAPPHPRPRRQCDATLETALDTPPRRNSSPCGTADVTTTSPMPISPSGPGSDYGEGGEAGEGSRGRRGVGSRWRRTGSAEEEEGHRSSSGKKRPRPEPGDEGVVAVPADRRGGGGRDDEVVVDPRRVGEGGRREAAAAATRAAAAAAAATGALYPRHPGGGSDAPGEEGTERENKRRRRRKAGWGWGLLRLWNRSSSGQSHDDNDDHHHVGAACPAIDGKSTAELPPDRRQENQQPPAKALGARSAERRSDERGDEERHDVEDSHGAGRKGFARAGPGRAGEVPTDRGRDSAPAAAPARRSPLVITVVLAPPPPPSPMFSS